MNMIEVRPAADAELPAVADLRWRWAAENQGRPTTTYDEFIRWFVEWAQRNSAAHRCLVAVRDGTVLGMAWLATTPRVPSPLALVRASGDVQCVYVCPEYRNSGIGGQLVDGILALAESLGLKRVTVHSSERAVRAYTRSGFTASPQLLQVDPRNH
ncbi:MULTISPECIES: GNAT family N-acetyltransferase [unclassified Nocardia]|uniref:GNAT family N-acetyltransferase n=1 Tax=unclassified Nocardia TaxID=2637762 RepID=UPI001CE47DB2|nr:MULTISPECIES: GNAT family N-acetyltransferase [unclassified Nocardia]